jgi:hypothetical protein
MIATAGDLPGDEVGVHFRSGQPLLRVGKFAEVWIAMKTRKITSLFYPRPGTD